jgi:D-sedoheptulose 7-phosphate isomerase
VDLPDRFRERFAASLLNLNLAQARLADPVTRAAELIVSGLLSGGKLLACGNGGMGVLSQYFTTRMLHRFERERPGLPALALTADCGSLTVAANEVEYRDVFARQISAVGHPGDLLLVVSAEGEAANIVRAVEVAHERQMRVIALTGSNGGLLGEILGEHDIEIRAPSDLQSQILETHLLTVHCLCDLVDTQLLGS